MFGFLKHVLHDVASPFEDASHFVAHHWKTIAVAAASTVVFVGVTALTGGLGAPAMAALLAGGFASGVSGYALGDYLNGAPITLKGALLAGGLSGLLTVATAGVGRALAPLLPEISTPAIDELASSRAGSLALKAAINAGAGSGLGATERLATNAIERHPLGQGVGDAAFQGGLNGLFMVPAERLEEPLGALGAAFRGRTPDVALTTGTASSDAAPSTGPAHDIISLPEKFAGNTWTRAEGDLFVNGVAASDARQGQLGDCYFVASMAAVADDRPGIVQNLIQLRPDGNYDVTLTDPSTLEATTTTLTSAVPMRNDGQALFAKLTQPGLDQNELWPSLVEKGYADVNGGYDEIAGRWPKVSLTALTGTPASELWIQRSAPDQVWDTLVAADRNDWPTVASVPEAAHDPLVHGDHSYTFLGTGAGDDGERYVTLRNPWGYDPGTDGVFDMPYSQFLKTFNNLAWVDLGGPADPSESSGPSDPSRTTGIAGALGAGN